MKGGVRRTVINKKLQESINQKRHKTGQKSTLVVLKLYRSVLSGVNRKKFLVLVQFHKQFDRVLYYKRLIVNTTKRNNDFQKES